MSRQEKNLKKAILRGDANGKRSNSPQWEGNQMHDSTEQMIQQG